jgi:hypothetical protein
LLRHKKALEHFCASICEERLFTLPVLITPCTANANSTMWQKVWLILKNIHAYQWSEGYSEEK